MLGVERTFLRDDAFMAEVKKGDIRKVVKLEYDDSAATKRLSGRGPTWWVPKDSDDFGTEAMLLPRRRASKTAGRGRR